MQIFEWKNDPVVLPLKQAFPEFGSIKEYASRQCIFSHDRSRVFAVAGKNYQPVPHRILIDGVERALAEVGQAKSKRSITTTNGGARMFAHYRFQDLKAEPQVGDVVHLGIRILNSYDLTWKLDIRLYAHQLVCKNGAVLGKEFGSISGKHFKGVIGEDMNVLSAGIKSMASSAWKISKRWETWQSTSITEATATAMLDRATWVPKKHRDYILAGLFPMSMWDLYCRFTFAATHMTASTNRRVELDDSVAQLFYQE